jgi:2-keto-3-deoxy-L-fuconate dehydrogenase
MFTLNSKTAVITGGGSGIGKAIAELFAAQGATVHILELNNNAADETIQLIKKSAGKAFVHACNVAEQEQVNTVFTSIIEKAPIDILVNSAGVAHIGNIEKTNAEDMTRIFNVNVRGVYHTMQAAILHMKPRRTGVILNVASVASTVGISDRFAYSMSKGAVMSMTLSVAKDYIKDNIRCNCISPARVHTAFVDNFLKANYPGKEEEMFDKLSKTQPIGRMGKPEEIAALALYLCSDEASFVTGCDYPIDGGFTRLNT